MSDFQEYISNFFFELLLAHGLESSRHNDWVTVSGGFPAFRGFYEQPQTENTSGALSVQIMLDEHSLIEECFAALGDSHKDAINGALDQFMLSMFHPIISACCDYSDDEQITKEIWKLKMFSTADIWYGNIAYRMSTDASVAAPHDWLTHISAAFKTANTNKGYNWITLYCSRLNSDPLMASAVLNNSDWAAGLTATTNLHWPKLKGFYGARLFILIRR